MLIKKVRDFINLPAIWQWIQDTKKQFRIVARGVWGIQKTQRIECTLAQ